MPNSDFALVTGASSGIGEELARLFAKAGIPVVLVSRQKEKLDLIAGELRRQYGIEAHVFACDLSDPASAQRVFDFCQMTGLQVRYLVNNAGFGDYGPFSDSDPDKQQRMIGVNIGSLTLLTRLFLPSLLSAGRGRILQVASMAAFLPGPGMAVYYATKAYVLHFSEAVSAEISGSGVTVTTLCPGPTYSGFYDAAGMQGIRLFELRKVPTARKVAEFGYSAMMRGKRVAVYDRSNALTASLIGFFPRGWVLRTSQYLNGKYGSAR
ncbi:MAG: hypothetical protein RL021_106 [Bacteroidota bacterium]|jgi:uncharacterized protein